MHLILLAHVRRSSRAVCSIVGWIRGLVAWYLFVRHWCASYIRNDAHFCSFSSLLSFLLYDCFFFMLEGDEGKKTC